jgi:hypothetical protein
VRHAALDDTLAVSLLGERYIANAHPYSLDFQNCNQWLIELLATAWSSEPKASGPTASTDRTLDLKAAKPPAGQGRAARERAQRWLAAQGYDPAPVQVNSHLLMAAAPFVTLLDVMHHPEADRMALRFKTSLPDSMETFMRRRTPELRRLEFCQNERHIVVREGWMPLEEGCVARAGDRIVALD